MPQTMSGDPINPFPTPHGRRMTPGELGDWARDRYGVALVSGLAQPVQTANATLCQGRVSSFYEFSRFRAWYLRLDAPGPLIWRTAPVPDPVGRGGQACAAPVEAARGAHVPHEDAEERREVVAVPVPIQVSRGRSERAARDGAAEEARTVDLDARGQCRVAMAERALAVVGGDQDPAFAQAPQAVLEHPASDPVHGRGRRHGAAGQGAGSMGLCNGGNRRGDAEDAEEDWRRSPNASDPGRSRLPPRRCGS